MHSFDNVKCLECTRTMVGTKDTKKKQVKCLHFLRAAWADE